MPGARQGPPSARLFVVAWHLLVGVMGDTLLSACSYTLTFFLSSIYHVCCASSYLSVIGRLGDYLGIYVAFGISFLLDLSLVASNLKGVGWISISDVWIAVGIMMLFFLFRRAIVPITEERLACFGEHCSIGFARFSLKDKEHAPLRSIFGISLLLTFVLNISASFETGITSFAFVYTLTRTLATLLLLSGIGLPAGPVARPGRRPPAAPWSCEMNAGATSPWLLLRAVRRHMEAETRSVLRVPACAPGPAPAIWATQVAYVVHPGCLRAVKSVSECHPAIRTG